MQREVEPWRGWAGGSERVRVRRVAFPVGFRIQPGDRAVMVKGASSIQRSSAAPNLFHFPRQRDRVGRVVSTGMEAVPRAREDNQPDETGLGLSLSLSLSNCERLRSQRATVSGQSLAS